MRKNSTLFLSLSALALVSASGCGARSSRTFHIQQDTTPAADAAIKPQDTNLHDATAQKEAEPSAEESPLKERDLGKGGDKEPLGDDKKQERDLGKGADKEPTPNSP